MGKNKLRKFSEMETIPFVYQYPFAALQDGECPLRGKWGAEVFGNDNPIVLELGCGKGEYTVGLAKRFSDKNFIGIDIKGARMWSGATEALEKKMTNVAFLRTSIELLEAFFAPGEISEIWITFPDPQMKKVRKRLTSTRFLNLYRTVAGQGALIHLKTDSPFLYSYTREMVKLNALDVITDSNDLYADANLDAATRELLGIRTYYEQQWLSRGFTIKYLNFRLPDAATILAEPDIEIPYDTYRSFSRDTASRLKEV